MLGIPIGGLRTAALRFLKSSWPLKAWPQSGAAHAALRRHRPSLAIGNSEAAGVGAGVRSDGLCSLLLRTRPALQGSSGNICLKNELQFQSSNGLRA